MKTLQSLIRLHSWQLEEKRRTLAGLEGLRADFVAQGERLEQELVNEQRAATASPEYAITYEGYAKAVILRRANLAASITETDGKIEVARDEVQEAYREMRKYEIAEERAQKRAAAEEARLEQAEMEEIASTQFRLRQREKTEFLLLPSPPSLAGEHLRWADGGGWHSFKDWLGLVPSLAGRGAPAVGGLWGVAQLQGLARPGPLPRLRGRVREGVGPKRGAWISRWQKKSRLRARSQTQRDARGWRLTSGSLARIVRFHLRNPWQLGPAHWSKTAHSVNSRRSLPPMWWDIPA